VSGVREASFRFWRPDARRDRRTVKGVRGERVVAKDVLLGGAAMRRAEPAIGEATGAEELRPIAGATALVGVGSKGEGSGAGDAGEGDGGTRGHEGYLLLSWGVARCP